MRNICFVLALTAITSLSAPPTTTNAPPFTVTISAPHPPVKLSEPVMIHIILKSTSQNEIRVLQELHEGDRGEMNYRITVKDGTGALLPDSDEVARRKSGHGAMDHNAIDRLLNKGDEIAEDADLNHVVKITRPGDYTVQVERADPLSKDWHIKSNELVIHVDQP